MASQSKKKQPFRFWPWKRSPTPRATGKTSSLKPPKMTPPTLFKSTPEVAPKPPSKGPSLPTSTSLPPSPLLAPPPTGSPSRSTSDEVTRAQEQQPSPPAKLSPTSSPIPRYEDPMQMAKTPTTQLSLEDEQKVPSPPHAPSPTASPSRRRTDEVPQWSSHPSKVSLVASSSPGGSRREDPATSTEISPAPSQDAPQEVSQTPSTHQQEILPQESQTTQPPKQVEKEHLIETETLSAAPELQHTIETMIPTSRTFPNGTPNSVMDVEKEEGSKASTPTQVDGRNESDEQHVNGEATTKDLEVTKEEITSKEGQTIEHPKIPQSESKEENKLVQRLNIENSWRHGGTEHGMHIITLAGENNGASMHIGRKALGKAGPRRGSKIEEHPSAESKEVPSISTSVNNNVQSINNSLFHQSSCSQEDPGVHLIISSKPAKSVDSKDEMGPIASTLNINKGKA